MGAQSAPGFGIQGADPQLLGPLVTFIEILGYPRVAAGVVQAGPPCGFVSGAAKELPIDETFDGNNGMFPARQPIIGKPGTAQGQSAGGQIR